MEHQESVASQARVAVADPAGIAGILASQEPQGSADSLGRALGVEHQASRALVAHPRGLVQAASQVRAGRLDILEKLTQAGLASLVGRLKVAGAASRSSEPSRSLVMGLPFRMSSTGRQDRLPRPRLTTRPRRKPWASSSRLMAMTSPWSLVATLRGFLA